MPSESAAVAVFSRTKERAINSVDNLYVGLEVQWKSLSQIHNQVLTMHTKLGYVSVP